MTLITLLLLTIPVAAFIIFWKFAWKRKWRSVPLLALTVGLSLWFTTLILWLTTNVNESWILMVGTTFSIFVTLVVLSFPIIAPEVVVSFNFSADLNGGMSTRPGKQHLAGPILFAIYLILGYLIMLYFVDPGTFFQDLPNRWWLIPFVLIMAVMRMLFLVGKKK